MSSKAPFATLRCPCGCLQPDPKRMWCPACLLEVQEAYQDAYLD
jgi:hypothetical protein